MIKHVVTLFLLFGLPFVVFSQTSKKDSSSAEIKKQALEMREKLNKYMAEKLGTTENGGTTVTPGMSVLLDSVADMLTKQQAEIEALKAKFSEIEVMKTRLTLLESDVQNGTIGGKVNSAKPKKSGKGFKLVDSAMSLAGSTTIKDEHTLILYFSFDKFDLSETQIRDVKDFVAGHKKIDNINIKGYTDWRGTEQYNQKLCINRSFAVKKVIKRKGARISLAAATNCNAEVAGGVPQFCRKVELTVR